VPAATCNHPEGPTSGNFFQKMFGLGGHRELVLPPIAPVVPPSSAVNPNGVSPGQPNVPPAAAPEVTGQPTGKEKKRGFWKRLFGGSNKDTPSPVDPGQGQTDTSH
jgi:penicillin-binding protein 1B